MIVDGALAAAPREGACLALCRISSGATRETYIVSQPLTPVRGDLSYERGLVVSLTAHYWNRLIDTLVKLPKGTGVLVLHTHPGAAVPEWSSDDNRADTELATFLYGQGFLRPDASLVSLVASRTHLRGRRLEVVGDSVCMTPIERVRTVHARQIEVYSTADREAAAACAPNWAVADRSVRVFGRDGQRRLADLHIAVVGTGGVGSMSAEHIARWGVGVVSLWDPDVIEHVNINRSGTYTFADATRKIAKVAALTRALPGIALHRDIRVRARQADVRERGEATALLDADLILMLVDDARPRHFLNALAYAHYIPVLDGGNVIRSTAEDDPTVAVGTIEGGGVRVSTLAPGAPCLWCTRNLTSEGLSEAYRTKEDKAADRARGYVEHLGPEHAPSVIPMNVMTAALILLRLQDLVFGLTGRAVAELHYDLIGGTLDELPRTSRPRCPHCSRDVGLGDLAPLPFRE